MQTLRLPEFSSLHSSCKKYRLDCYPSRLSLDLSLSKPTPAPCWASIPTPPMSGSPSPKDPFEPPQVAGRRRKRSDTPPIAASAAPAVPATILEESSQRRQAAQQRGTPIQTGAGIQAPPYPSAYSSTQSFGYGPPGPTHPGPAPSAFDPRYGHERASPKATRKTKAHVASACVNCKKKHLRCDSARPCRRCVQAGKEVSKNLCLSPKL